MAREEEEDAGWKDDFYRFETHDLHGIARSKVVPKRHAESGVYLYGGVLGVTPWSEPHIFNEVVDSPQSFANVRLVPVSSQRPSHNDANGPA